MLPERLETERLLILRNSLERAAEAACAIAESFDHLAPWQDWVLKFDGEASTIAFSNWANRQWGRRFDYQILRHKDGRFLGQIALESYRPDVPAIEIGYWLRQDAVGQGYVTEAASALQHLAFEELRVKRFALLCDQRNTRSAAVAKRLGLTLESVMRKERMDAGGLPQDTMFWAMTDDDWSAQR